jgi:hypothetical protein
MNLQSVVTFPCVAFTQSSTSAEYVFGDAATVKIDAAEWVDYLHLGRWNGVWKILNVLWERKPAAQER